MSQTVSSTALSTPPEQSRCFAVESDGIGDDLDGFISAITTIAQLRCERATDYEDIETLVRRLLIDQWTFATHDLKSSRQFLMHDGHWNQLPV